MRILILSCNTGAGHNSAAAAIKEYAESIGHTCQIVDGLAFRSELKSKFISRGHVFVYKKAPHLFGSCYQYLENHPTKQGKNSMMYHMVKGGSGRLYRYITENKVDLIISTHVFASIITTEIRKKHDLHIPHYLILTDYTCYPGVSEIDADKFIIPHKNLIPEFVEKGIPAEKLLPYGIPVKESFYHREDEATAKKELGIPENRRLILMMCGSMGCGPLTELAEKISHTIPNDCILTVICGNNKKLYEKFGKADLKDNVSIIGYTKKMSLYMDAATVILTKPGGLSTTEAASKARPMVFIDAIPGFESRNMEFFTGNGFAVTAEGIDGLADAVCDLLSHPEKQKEMEDRLHASFSDYTAKKIVDAAIAEVDTLHG